MSAWGIADFRFLWGGRAISLLGSSLLVVAVPAHVYALTGSVFATGLTLAAEYLPALVLGPMAGVVVDRWDRQRVMIAADLLRAAAVAAMLVGTPTAIYVAVVLESVGAVVFRPAAQAHVPAVVGTGDALSSANSWNAATSGVVGMVGPPLGGVLLVWAGFEVLVGLDVASYLLSAAAIAMTRKRTTAAKKRTGGTAGERATGDDPELAAVEGRWLGAEHYRPWSQRSGPGSRRCGRSSSPASKRCATCRWHERYCRWAASSWQRTQR